MKKKNKLQALAFMLVATLTMALTSPMSAKAEKFEPVSLADRKTESNLYGGMVLPQMDVATDAAEEYNLVDQSDKPATEQVRSYYVKNSHGDIIGQVDEYGNLLNSYAYNAFGELVAAVTIQPEETKNTSRFLYAGEQYDETSGLYYLRARCYDADAGRFTQEDTYLGDGRNLYAYTHNNPLKYVDPSGHAVVTCKDDGRTQDDFQERNMAGGGAGKPVTVNYNGTQSTVYRGGNNFKASSKDVRINPTTGLLKTSHGISLNVNPSSLSGFGGAYRIETMPMGVDIIQRGMSPEHYEIVPTYPMTFNRYQDLLNQISVTGPY